MKFQNFLKAMLIIVVSVVLVSCSKTEKERIIDFNNDVIEWFISPNFMKDLKAKVKTPDQMQEYITSNINRMAKDNGFKDQKETEAAFKKLANDKDLEKLLKETEEKVKPRFMEMQQFQMELMQQTMPELMQAPAPDSTQAKPE